MKTRRGVWWLTVCVLAPVGWMVKPVGHVEARQGLAAVTPAAGEQAESPLFRALLAQDTERFDSTGDREASVADGKPVTAAAPRAERYSGRSHDRAAVPAQACREQAESEACDPRQGEEQCAAPEAAAPAPTAAPTTAPSETATPLAATSDVLVAARGLTPTPWIATALAGATS